MSHKPPLTLALVSVFTIRRHLAAVIGLEVDFRVGGGEEAEGGVNGGVEV